jgi:hypothetical protein
MHHALVLFPLPKNLLLSTKSRIVRSLEVIYSLKELAHFLYKLLVDFLLVQYTNFMPYSKTHMIKRIYLKLRLRTLVFICTVVYLRA